MYNTYIHNNMKVSKDFRELFSLNCLGTNKNLAVDSTLCIYETAYLQFGLFSINEQ